MADGPFQRLRQFLAELKRRKVYRVAATYVVVGFVLIQIADLTFVRLGLPSWTVTLVIVLVAMGFPLALVLAWAFEVTPEGVRRTPEARPVEEEPAPAEVRARTGYKVLIGLGLVAAAVAGGWYLMGGGGQAEVRDRTVAVLPFEPLGDSAAGSLTGGVHNSLITRLQQVSDLTVKARPAVMRYEGSEKTLATIADELNVRWIVTGAVQTADGRILVNPRLVNPRDGTERWSDSYRRSLTAEDLFTLQSEITRQIARSLETELSPGEQERLARQSTGNLDAYRLYVEGRRLLDRRTTESIREATGYFERALKEDSAYARAWAGLADARGLYPFHGLDSLGGSVAAQERAARRAVELAPDLAEARASLGYTHLRKTEGPVALRELQRAVELKPSYAQAHHWLGGLYLFLGRPERALEHVRLAVELNPRHWNARSWLIRALMVTGDYEQALTEARRGQELFPQEASGFSGQELDALMGLKRWDELRRQVQRAGNREDGPQQEAGLLWRLLSADVATGDTATARERFDRIREQTTSPWYVPYARAVLGDHESAFDSLRSLLSAVRDPVYGAREGVLGFLSGTLRYDPADLLGAAFRADPRYEKLIGEVNQIWGLNPDGSLPDSVDVSFGAQFDE